MHKKTVSEHNAFTIHKLLPISLKTVKKNETWRCELMKYSEMTQSGAKKCCMSEDETVCLLTSPVIPPTAHLKYIRPEFFLKVSISNHIM